MKAAVLALVLTAIAPIRITLGPVSVSALALLAAVEVFAGAGGLWLVLHVIRRGRPRWRHTWLAGGAW